MTSPVGAYYVLVAIHLGHGLNFLGGLKVIKVVGRAM